MNFYITVVGVGLAGQQRLQFGLGGAFVQRFQRRVRFGRDIGVVFGFRQFKQFKIIRQLAFKPVDFLQARLKPGALAHHSLSFVGIVPEFGVFGLGVQF